MGATEGPATGFNWTSPSFIPPLLPWLAILFLLSLKPNRSAKAWWILAPLGCLAVLANMPQSVVQFMSSRNVAMFQEIIFVLGFGLATAWLLSFVLPLNHRFITFLAFLGVLAAGSLIVFGIRQTSQGWGIESMPVAIILAISTLVISVALHLGARLCRGHYASLRFCLWSLGTVLAVWLAIATPFLMFILFVAKQNAPVIEFFGGVLGMGAFTFGILLPFLLLSFTNSFYRERLKNLLHFVPEPSSTTLAPPPLIEVPVGK